MNKHLLGSNHAGRVHSNSRGMSTRSIFQDLFLAYPQSRLLAQSFPSTDHSSRVDTFHQQHSPSSPAISMGSSTSSSYLSTPIRGNLQRIPTRLLETPSTCATQSMPSQSQTWYVNNKQSFCALGNASGMPLLAKARKQSFPSPTASPIYSFHPHRGSF
ncbi:conserved hypothetical protein [Lodderomyces elongisporus NRRL YB-4239]|uniref:Uncharacterized protein n=1 Tax=Lodderomyces elongisporus (strain ATCC 11503 / CBS 2605 / JCM 1781 / NBRC 1676 / NRRL YB-4239) TaxID=379508 RepID=A5DY74_LODEL|nr:conserved hypothetical protein [Lodderomyces elongisporus NRRL YB-4239]